MMPDIYRKRVLLSHCPACDSTPRGMIHCHRCATSKPARDFYRNRKAGPGAYHAGCKDCRREASAAHDRAVYVPRRAV